MRRSIPALILGFLSGLLNLLWAYIFYFFGGLAFAFSNGETSYILIFSFVFLACAVIGIVGSFFCIKKANIGAIILLIASTPTSGFLLYSFITTLISGSFDFLQLFIAPIAILLMVLSVVCSFKSKSID